ncbi:MAG: hypothetical protein GAK45_02319 [Pseudomonas citronellolis]|nr:MAG: hypothetical protein GAK45_02319 [Pseudomonas citronellolis]
MNQTNLDGWERALSIGLGLIGVVKGVRRGGAQGWLEAGAAALIVRRGLTGHCRLKQSLVAPRPPAQVYIPRTTSTLRRPSRLERKVDRALEETFPASDPTSP